jgi:membrane protease YdiL (CAAX protease family)
MAGSEMRPTVRASVAVIMVFQVCALFARGALDIVLVRKGLDRSISNDLSYLIVPPILAVLLIPYLRQCKGPLLGLLRPGDLTARLIVLSVSLGLLLRMTYFAFLTLLMRAGVVVNDDTTALAGPVFGFGCPPLTVLAFSVAIMSFAVPIVEEVVNRGLLLHTMLDRGRFPAVIISAFLFAAMHKPASYVIAFSIGVLLAVQTLNSRTLWASLLTHGAYNLAATIHWDCFRIVWNPPPSDPGLVTASRIAAPVALGGAMLCCWLVSKQAIGARRPRLPDDPG